MKGCKAQPHRGHRARMKESFALRGMEGFRDHELLEMLLYTVIPRRDTNPIAHNLLAAFGSLDGVLSASIKALAAVPGMGERAAEFLHIVGRESGPLFAPQTREALALGERLDTYTAAGNYCLERFCDPEQSHTAVLLLDSAMHPLHFAMVSEQDFACTEAECMLADAISLRAPVLILAHNHPYGAPMPTPDDHYKAKEMRELSDAAGVLLLEHYIICGRRYFGFCAGYGHGLRQTTPIRAFLQSKEVALRAR